MAGGRCAYCDEEIAFEDMEVDHQDPWAQGGLHCWCNWACSCAPCNRRKWDMAYDRWMDQLERERKWAALLADPVFRAECEALSEAARREDHKWRAGTVQDRLFEAAA